MDMVFILGLEVKRSKVFGNLVNLRN